MNLLLSDYPARCGRIFVLMLGLFSGKVLAASETAASQVLSVQAILQVGGALLFVLALIIFCAHTLRKLNRVKQRRGQTLQLLGSLSLGVKERVVVVEVNGQQLVIGVTPNQINLLQVLADNQTTNHKPAVEQNGFDKYLHDVMTQVEKS